MFSVDIMKLLERDEQVVPELILKLKLVLLALYLSLYINYVEISISCTKK